MSDEDDNEIREVPGDTHTWRYMVMRDLKSLERRVEKCVTKEMFDAKVGPIQKVLWLIFSVVTSGLVMALLAVLMQSGKFSK